VSELGKPNLKLYSHTTLSKYERVNKTVGRLFGISSDTICSLPILILSQHCTRSFVIIQHDFLNLRFVFVWRAISNYLITVLILFNITFEFRMNSRSAGIRKMKNENLTFWVWMIFAATFARTTHCVQRFLGRNGEISWKRSESISRYVPTIYREMTSGYFT
jgi:hypothetical protein